MALDNLVYCKMLRFIEILYKLTFHLLREDGLGRLWYSDGSLDFAAITKSH